MKLRFIGQYTNGHTSISMGEVTFEGREPAEVPEGDLLRRLRNNPEFEAISPLDHDGDGVKGGSPAGENSTVRRGRKKKAS